MGGPVCEYRLALREVADHSADDSRARQPLSVDFLSDGARQQWQERAAAHDFQLRSMLPRMDPHSEAAVARWEARTRSTSTSSPHRLRGSRGRSTHSQKADLPGADGEAARSLGLRVAVFIAMPTSLPTWRQGTPTRAQSRELVGRDPDAELCLGVVYV